MAAPKTKFMFDADFASGANPNERPVSGAELTLRIAEAESRAFRDGYAAAEREKVAEAERRTALAFEQIGDGIDRLSRGLKAVASRLEAEAVEVAASVGRKLAPVLIENEPLAEIEALATDCLRQLVAAPHVAVRVNDALQDTARARLDSIARDRGFDGRLIVIGDPDIAPGDCRIDWADGGLVRDLATIDKAISAAVARYLAATRDTTQLELEGIKQ
jgi:flagellar assembly protein FliH